jgi:hypothetical protein
VNPQLLQMLLPYLMQLFGQGGAGGQSPLTSMFGQNGQNALAQSAQPTGTQNALQPTGGSVQAPSGVVGGATPVTGAGTGFADPNAVPSPQNQISPTGAPQSMQGLWSSLMTGLQNNSLTSGQPTGFGG